MDAAPGTVGDCIYERRVIMTILQGNPVKRIIFCFCMIMSLSACTSYFGLSKEEWDSLSPTQQSAVIKAYNERAAERQQAENERAIIAEQNAPLNNLIGALGAAIPAKEHRHHKRTYERRCNAEGTRCTSTSSTRSSGWHIGD
ncbi:MAG: hypothetical protein JJT82_01910 [Legionellaceae bacterium]|nr:hypothetical protein [Legionellaceae bacterium]